MRLLAIIMLLVGIAYAWFAFYEPTPRGRGMQGTVNAFQEAIHSRDLAAMQELCGPQARDECERILNTIAETEERTRSTMARVGSIGFDFPRGRTTVDGMISVSSDDGDTLWSGTVRVSQMEGSKNWQIELIR